MELTALRTSSTQMLHATQVKQFHEKSAIALGGEGLERKISTQSFHSTRISQTFSVFLSGREKQKVSRDNSSIFAVEKKKT